MQGNYAPIREELTVRDLPVEGRIPAELNESYLRNGFNPPGAVPFHWFFGAGMVHGFELRDGRVAYRNRYVRTPYLEHDMDLMTAMGDLRASPANTNVIRHAGRLLALEEAQGQIMVQVCRAGSLMEGGMGDLGDQATLWQWTIDPGSGTVKEEQLDDRPGDFPRVDDRRVGLPQRYGYVAGLVPGPSPMFSSEIYRYDLHSGASQVHALGGAGTHVFEPVFAPAGPDAAEDEGWLLVLSHDDATETTTLNMLDAQDFTASPVARVPLPQSIPFGAHGNWLPDSN
jgi:carotenoid cleavage dioxygenase-like enzyme